MIDILSVAKKRLKELGYEGVGLKRLDPQSSKEGIIVRPLPGTTKDKYFDRSKTSYVLFQVLVKREDEERAMVECCDIADTLPDMELGSENGSYRFIGIETYTDPQELVLTEGLHFVWQVRFRAEVYRKA